MIVACFKWKRQGRYQLPNICDYDHRHVNALFHGVRKHLPSLTDFVCVTDDPTGIHSDVRIVPLWLDHLDLGGCYVRLRMYGDGGPLIGQRFLMIDLDAVITGDLTPIADRTEDLVLNRYCLGAPTGQLYNGALQLMDCGSRPWVWQAFRGKRSADQVEARKDLIGTDQAWLSHILGPGEATFGPEHGIYDMRNVRKCLPEDARVVMFHGKRDPSKPEWRWVNEYWRPNG